MGYLKGIAAALVLLFALLGAAAVARFAFEVRDVYRFAQAARNGAIQRAAQQQAAPK